MILSTDTTFIQPIIQGAIKPTRDYRLIDDYRFEWTENGKRYARTVFRIDPDTRQPDETDLASVPDAGAALGFEQEGPSDGAAVIHDNAYERRGKFLPGEFQIQQPDGTWIDCYEDYPRTRADGLYFKMCRLGGMRLGEADIEYLALRVAGGLKDGAHWFLS